MYDIRFCGGPRDGERAFGPFPSVNGRLRTMVFENVGKPPGRHVYRFLHWEWGLLGGYTGVMISESVWKPRDPFTPEEMERRLEEYAKRADRGIPVTNAKETTDDGPVPQETRGG